MYGHNWAKKCNLDFFKKMFGLFHEKTIVKLEFARSIDLKRQGLFSHKMNKFVWLVPIHCDLRIFRSRRSHQVRDPRARSWLVTRDPRWWHDFLVRSLHSWEFLFMCHDRWFFHIKLTIYQVVILFFFFCKYQEPKETDKWNEDNGCNE